MELIQWRPFDEIDRFMGDMPAPYRKLGGDLSVDLYEEGDNVIAKMNIPGIEAEDLDIIVEDDALTVSGSREEEKETDEKDYYSKEIRRGSFSRTVRLPKAVDSERATADYQHGVLVVTMPKAKGQEEKGVKIAVNKK